DRHEGPDRAPDAAGAASAGRPLLRRSRQGLGDLHPAGARRGGRLPGHRGDPGPHRTRGGRRRRRGPRQLHLAPGRRHAGERRAGPRHRHPAGGGDRPLRHVLRTAADRGRPRVRHRPARRHPERRLRLLGGGRAGARDGALPPVGGREPDLDPVLRRAGLDQRSDHADHRRGPGRHDPADHLRHLARGLRPDPAAAPRSGPGPRRDPLGDDPDGGASLRQVRGDRRLHAGPGPSARRDDGRRDRALRRRRRHAEPDQQHQPVDDRLQHRPQLRRGHRAGRQHADRERAGALPHHPGGQHAGAVDRQPPGRLLRSEL
ncbi:MAG: Phosphate transport system permease protein PstC, partial [uncultured Thermomicrobiales bacterium]